MADEQVAQLYATLEVIAETKSVEEMEAALESVDKQLGSVTKGIEEARQAQKDYEEWTKAVTVALDALGISAEEWATQLQRNEEAMKTARAEQEKLGAEMAKDYEATAKSMGGWEALEGVIRALTRGSLTDLIGAFGKLPSLALAVGGAFWKVASAVQSLAAEAEQLQNKALTTGMTAEAVQGFRRLGEEAGVGATTVENAIVRMQRVAESNGKAFAKLGVDMRSFLGKDTEAQFNLIAEKVTKLGTASERTAALTSLFGRGMAQQLMPVIEQLVNKGMPEMVALSEKQVQSLASLDDAIDSAQNGWSDLSKQFLAMIADLPGLEEGLEGIGKVLKKIAGYIKEDIIPGLREWKASFKELMAAETQEQRVASMEVVNGIDNILKAKKDAQKAGQSDMKFGVSFAGMDALGAGKVTESAQKVIFWSQASGESLEQLRAKHIKLAGEANKTANELIKEADETRNGIPPKEAAGRTTAIVTAEMRKLQTAMDDLSGAKIDKEFESLQKALLGLGSQGLPKTATEAEKLGNALAKTRDIPSLVAKLQKFETAGVKLPPLLAQLTQGYRDYAVAVEETDRAFKEAGPLMELPMARSMGAGSMLGNVNLDLTGLGSPAEQKAQLKAEKAIRDEAHKQFVADQKMNKFSAVAGGLSSLGGMIGGDTGAALNAGSSITSSLGAYNQQMKDLRENKAGLSKEDQKAAMEQAKLNAVVNIGGAAAEMLGGALAKSTNPNLAKMGGALQGAAAGAKMGMAFGPWGAAIGAVGGAIVGFINKGKQLRAEMEKIKNAFVESAGGMAALEKKAGEAGINLDKVWKAKSPAEMKKAVEAAQKQMEAFDKLVEKHGGTLDDVMIKARRAKVDMTDLFNAKTPEEYLKAVEGINKELDEFDRAMDLGNSIMEKYGLTIDQMGPKFAQLKLDSEFGTIIEEWTFLVGIGADLNAYLEKLSPNMGKFLDAAVRSGAEIPQAMKPVIDALWEQGKLIHENGQAYTEEEYKALKYGKTQTEMFDAMIKKITELVNALLGIPTEREINIHTNYTSSEGGGGGGGRRERPDDDVPMAEGGIITRPTRILAGEAGREAIIPLSGGGGLPGGISKSDMDAMVSKQTRELAKVFRDAVLQSR